VSDRPEVLFVCVHNAGRSQMAAALLHHHAGGSVTVRSAGSAPADSINPAVVAVMDEIEKQTGRSLNISAVHAVLTRLEEKNLLVSKMSEPTDERGGRRKRIFSLTATGKQALEETNEMRNQLFNQIPNVALQFKLA